MRSLSETITRRSTILFTLIVLGFLLILARIGFIMVYSSSQSFSVENLRGQDPQSSAPRGKIVGTKGTILATSIQRKSLYGNPRKIENTQQISETLAKTLDQSPSYYSKRLNKDRYFIWLARKLSPDQVKRVKKLELTGIGFVPEYEREYPYGTLAGQVLGFVGVDNAGLEGVENQFNDLLTRDRETVDFKQPVSNPDDQNFVLKLTIDQTIQHIAEDELQTMADKENPKSAMAIVMEPQTGKIRAMAHLPSFNPNKFWEYDKSTRKNRIISNVFEPGSTLKVMTLATGLSEGDFKPEDEFTCNGYTYLRDAEHTLHCYSNHGTLNIPEILIESCNVGAVKAAEKISPKNYFRSLRNFGFGTPTGIRLPGESDGDLPRPSEWSALTQPTMAIGHGISASAIQMVTAMGAVVNDGELMKPRIIETIRKSGGQLQETKPFPIRTVIPEDIAINLKQYMNEVVNAGTGERAQSDRYDLGGKTGTAQKTNLEEGGYHQEKVMASFIGFGPVNNPQLVTAVFVDEPQEGRYGGEVAAPVFKRIMNRSLNYIEKSSQDPRTALR